jgi:hypothetical protein
LFSILMVANTSAKDNDILMSIFLWLEIGYLNVTINRNTRKLEPEIWTDWSSQTGQKPQVDGYGSAFGPPRCSWSVFWMGLEPNRTILTVRTWTAAWLPGLVANTRPSCLGCMKFHFD